VVRASKNARIGGKINQMKRERWTQEWNDATRGRNSGAMHRRCRQEGGTQRAAGTLSEKRRRHLDKSGRGGGGTKQDLVETESI